MCVGKKVKVFWVLFVITEVHLQKFEEGDVCVLSDNSPGRCLVIRDCPGAITELKSGLNPGTCGFKGNEPLVCCGTKKEDEYEVICQWYRKNLGEVMPPPAIVGGRDVILSDFPHMVALGYGTKDNIEWKCGGSLISERFVLTAAHCTKDDTGEVKFARMGDIHLDSTSSDVQDFLITKRIRHPDYKPPRAYHDIALVELDKPADFNVYVKPACLYTHPDTPQSSMIATGWGLTQNAGKASTILQQVYLDPFNNTECNFAFKSASKRKLPNGILEDKQICVGSSEEKDTCQGDSGGPLQLDWMEGGLYTIVGITSFGKACGTPDVPSVYTRVSYYVPWIKSIVWP